MEKFTGNSKTKATLLRLINLKLILSVWIVLTTGGLSAQTVNQLNLEISAMLSSALPEVVAEGEHLQSLVSDLHPTLIIQNGEFIQYGGDYSVKLECGTSSITSLYQPDEAFAGVEMILIKVQNEEDLQSIVQLDALMGFPMLKYVFFLCDVDPCPQSGQACEQEVFSAMIQGSGTEGLKVLYKVSVPM